MVVMCAAVIDGRSAISRSSQTRLCARRRVGGAVRPRAGVRSRTPHTVLSDGDVSLRNLQRRVPPKTTVVLDWFHIGMRFEHVRRPQSVSVWEQLTLTFGFKAIAISSARGGAFGTAAGRAAWSSLPASTTGLRPDVSGTSRVSELCSAVYRSSSPILRRTDQCWSLWSSPQTWRDYFDCLC
jgi:hypothetical protein